MKDAIFKIGILDANNGKIKMGKEVKQEEALKVAEKVSEWFDKQDTFFKGTPIWEYWKRCGILSKFEAVVSGNSWNNIATESIAVFDGNKGIEHEFFVEKNK